MQNKGFYSKTLNIRGQLVLLDRPLVMGILNITPDSFYDGGKLKSDKDVLTLAERMIKDGATFLDVGGYSTRPNAAEVNEEEETHRVMPVISLLARQFPGLFISVDTFRAHVARRAVEAGACLINDVSGGRDPEMFQTLSKLKVPYVLMHMRGTPQTMNQETQYEDLLHDISSFFAQRLFALTQSGVADVIIDPGFGFAKTVEQNFTLMHHLDHFSIHHRPIMVGISRKSMIWRTLETDPEGALNGTSVMNTLALVKGADILRVHDVKEAMQCVQLTAKTLSL